MNISAEIVKLKKERGAVILAHNYTLPEVQDIADFVGDSLELSRNAAECDAPVIVFCGVRFMAETAKILSPASTVLLPDGSAGCPMADMASPAAIRAYRAANPDVCLVAYINTTAATKTCVDICCTSGNAEKIVSSIPRDRRIMFLPDGNLGRNVAAKLGRDMEFWPGCCPVHNAIKPEDILAVRRTHPAAMVVVHPECARCVTEVADMALSTGGMLRHVRNSDVREVIVGTESGILHRMRLENPDKKFYSLSPEPICHDMKKITLDKLYTSLRDMSPCVELDEKTILAARVPIERMLRT